MGFFFEKSIACAWRLLPKAILSAALMAVSGCMGTGEILAVDPTTTGAIALPATTAATIAAAPQTDEDAVLRAVAEADLSRMPDGPFPWANRVTGSTGVISRLEETADPAAPCRAFTTSLHRYDGVALVSGTSCRDAAGGWNLTAFDAIR